MQALRAGEAASGDLRGQQSAALKVSAPDDAPGSLSLDLRVDDHPTPLAEHYTDEPELQFWRMRRAGRPGQHWPLVWMSARSLQPSIDWLAQTQHRRICG